MSRNRVLFAGLLMACVQSPPSAAPTPTKPLFFYTGKTDGSEAAFNPLSELLNEGLDVLDEIGYERHLGRQHFDVGFRTIARSVAHPADVVRAYGGMWNVVRNELLPLSAAGEGGGAWTGNYGLHMIGSGMVSARMREWYQLHDVPHPELAANATLAVTHLLNEVVEASHRDGYREETLPDLYLFDGLGMLLYHFPRVDRLGMSYRFDNGHALTVATGPRMLGLEMVDSLTQKQTASGWGRIALIYFDRDDSLLWSLMHDKAARLTRFNLYPGVVGIGPFSPGAFVQQRGSRVQFGLAARWVPGIGFGHQR